MNVRKVSTLIAAGSCAALSMAFMPSAFAGTAATTGNLETCTAYDSGNCVYYTSLTPGHCYSIQTSAFAGNYTNGTVYLYGGTSCAGRGYGLQPNASGSEPSVSSYKFSN